MSRIEHLEPEFVEFIPPEVELEPGKLYVSMIYTTMVHLCASGCGRKVVLPLNPARWNITFDGDTVSISPSVGNWDLPCRSHYWIRKNRIVWAGRWDDDRIAAGRRNDQEDIENYFAAPTDGKKKLSLWERLLRKQ